MQLEKVEYVLQEVVLPGKDRAHVHWYDCKELIREREFRKRIWGHLRGIEGSELAFAGTNSNTGINTRLQKDILRGKSCELGLG